jgi:hypothetical protein
LNLGEKADYEEEYENGIIFQEQQQNDKLSLEDLMSFIFESVSKRIFSISVFSITNASNTNETDGMEAIALLAVLHQFLTSFTENVISSGNVENPSNPSNTNNVAPFNPTPAGSHVGLSIQPPQAEQISSLPSPSASLSNVEYLSLNPNQFMDPELVVYSLRETNSRVFLLKLFDTMRDTLEQRITTYTNEQIKWIQTQKFDPKSPNVLLPFYRFPSLVMQIMEMTNDEVTDSQVIFCFIDFNIFFFLL